MRARSAMRLLLLGVLAPAVAILASAHAQTPFLTLDSPNEQGGGFAISVAVGDVNGDGKGDIAVGAFHEKVGSVENAGRAYVFSGADGSLLLALDSPNPQSNAYFGLSVAAGDVNGDGKAEVAVAAAGEDVGGNTNQGRVYVFSGANGSLLYTLDTPNPQGGASFGGGLAVWDVNGDGRADIAVGAAYEYVGGKNQGRVYVFSGANGSLLYTLDTPNPQGGASFGNGLAAGDVNGDGTGDIAVRAYLEDVGGNPDQGRAYVFSGTNGSLLYTLDTPNPQGGAVFGGGLAVGDVNGDGKGDIAVGAYYEDVGGITYQGRAYVFSGANGSLLYTLDTPNPQVEGRFGNSVAVGDVNGDGRADIAVGAAYEDVGGITYQGRAYVFSGTSGSLLLTLDSPNQPAYVFGYSLAVGDVNGDGTGDIAVGGRGERVYVFSGEPTPIPTPTRPPSVGGTVRLPPSAIAAEAATAPEGSDWTVGTYAALASVGAVVAIAVGGRYAKKRRRAGQG